MVSFFSKSDADSAKKSRTPLFSLSYPSYPFAFLDVEELKHFNYIYRTYTFDYVLIKDFVLF